MTAIEISALSLGFAGSLHCIGMCGPIAASLPLKARLKRQLFVNILIYNVGRVFTYALLGAIFGSVGQIFAFAGLQQSLSLVIGLGIVIVLILPKKAQSRLLQRVTESSLMKRFRKLWGGFMKRPKRMSFFIVGLLNGLLPCGLVYVALAGAIASSSWEGGARFMLLFGLGTIPALFIISWAGQSIMAKAKGLKRIILPIGAISLALLFILRGLNLDIPYISPDLTHAHESPACCSEK